MKKGQPMSEAEKARRREAAARQWTPEARAAASARAKERRAKSPSASTPSESSATSSPPALPPSPALGASGASGASSDRLLATLLEKLEATKTATSDARPELPEDDAEREAALRPARWPARVPVVATSELCRVLGLDPLSDDERAEGINAFAVLFWQLGLYRDGRVLVALWLFGVAAPRSAAFVKRRLEARNEGAAS